MCTYAKCILYTMFTINMCIQVAFLTCDVLVVATTESLASTRLYSRLLSWAQVIYFKMSRDTWNIPVDVSVMYKYGVATVSRIDNVIGLFCERAL